MFSLFKRSDEEKVVAESKFFTLIAALFTTVLVVSNIIAVKVADFHGFYLTAAVIFFPISYIISDILTEVYGYAAARRVLWTGFFCNFVAVAAIWVAIKLPGAPFFADQAAYAQTLGFSLRLLAASFVAYLIGGFSNSLVLAKMKVWMQGKKLWARTISSTVIGQGLDSFIFTSIAFWGVFAVGEVLHIAFYEWIAKTLFEVILTPITYVVIAFLKKKEGIDHYDKGTNFTPLKY